MKLSSCFLLLAAKTAFAATGNCESPVMPPSSGSGAESHVLVHPAVEPNRACHFNVSMTNGALSIVQNYGCNEARYPTSDTLCRLYTRLVNCSAFLDNSLANHQSDLGLHFHGSYEPNATCNFNTTGIDNAIYVQNRGCNAHNYPLNDTFCMVDGSERECFIIVNEKTPVLPLVYHSSDHPNSICSFNISAQDEHYLYVHNYGCSVEQYPVNETHCSLSGLILPCTSTLSPNPAGPRVQVSYTPTMIMQTRSVPSCQFAYQVTPAAEQGKVLVGFETCGEWHYPLNSTHCQRHDAVVPCLISYNRSSANMVFNTTAIVDSTATNFTAHVGFAMPFSEDSFTVSADFGNYTYVALIDCNEQHRPINSTHCLFDDKVMPCALSTGLNRAFESNSFADNIDSDTRVTDVASAPAHAHAHAHASAPANDTFDMMPASVLSVVPADSNNAKVEPEASGNGCVMPKRV